jgi:hypothetical protein
LSDLLTLQRHAGSACKAVSCIEVEASRPDHHTLMLSFHVTGIIADIALPAAVPSHQADGLWQQSCFEAFIGQPDTDRYCEINLSPSTAWAIYGFEGYRTAMAPLNPDQPPQITTQTEAGRFELRSVITLAGLSSHISLSGWRLGLSAVIEEKGGNLSYWALAHPSERPDFHDRDCFVHELRAAIAP